jgi:N-acetylmuramoyl-L-alanine amidase
LILDGVEIYQHPSPNFGARRDGLTPQIVVLHHTAMECAEAALTRLCDPSSEVSAHYLIEGQGKVFQLVAETDRAWHAGVGEWRGRADINSRSIGIELDNRGDHPFSHVQMTALETLLRQILPRWGIAPANVIGHSDMAPGRKFDPGPHFDWARLEAQGLAHPRGGDSSPAGDGADFVRVAAQAGFTAPCSPDELLHSTRLRFAPWRQGGLSPDDFTF